MQEEILSGEIINTFYKVHNTLGFGFLEKVYEKAMVLELSKKGFNVSTQVRIPVYYQEHIVGEYCADLIVNHCVICELKACESLCSEHERQLLNYLKASDIEVGLLLNFGRCAQFRRKLFTNDKKKLGK